MKLERPLVILDLETTGVWIEKDRIIEVGMIRLTPDGRRDIYVKRVHPGMPIPPAVTALTGISDDDVRGAPAFKELAGEILAFIGDADFAGFNVQRFDLPILEREYFDCGVKFDWRQRTVYDAQKIYHAKEKRDLKAAHRFYCGRELEAAHTALGDAEAVEGILSEQVARYGNGSDFLSSLGGLETDRPSDYFDRDRKFRWWNGELYPAFGKYGRRSSVREIAQKDPGYLRYLLTTDFGDDVKKMLAACLKGNFPSFNKI